MMIPIALPGFVTQSILPAWKYSGRRRTSFHNTREPTGNKSNIFLFFRYFRLMMTCRNQIKSLTAPRQKRLLQLHRLRILGQHRDLVVRSQPLFFDQGPAGLPGQVDHILRKCIVTGVNAVGQRKLPHHARIVAEGENRLAGTIGRRRAAPKARWRYCTRSPGPAAVRPLRPRNGSGKRSFRRNR